MSGLPSSGGLVAVSISAQLIKANVDMLTFSDSWEFWWDYSRHAFRA